MDGEISKPEAMSKTIITITHETITESSKSQLNLDSNAECTEFLLGILEATILTLKTKISDDISKNRKP